MLLVLRYSNLLFYVKFLFSLLSSSYLLLPIYSIQDGDTPLAYAAMYNNKEVVEVLLAAGANIDSKNNVGYY